MQIVSRAEWRARPPKNRASWGNVVGIAVHHTVTPATGDIASRCRGIQNFHMDTRGWWDIAYNYLIDNEGRIWEGRGLASRSGANGTKASNRAYVAVAFIGDFSNTTPSDAAIQAFTELRCMTIIPQFRKALAIKPHNAFKNTGCPGLVETLIPDLTTLCAVPDPPGGIDEPPTGEATAIAFPGLEEPSRAFLCDVVIMNNDIHDQVIALYDAWLGRGVEPSAMDWWHSRISSEGIMAPAFDIYNSYEARLYRAGKAA